MRSNVDLVAQGLYLVCDLRFAVPQGPCHPFHGALHDVFLLPPMIRASALVVAVRSIKAEGAPVMSAASRVSVVGCSLIPHAIELCDVQVALDGHVSVVHVKVDAPVMRRTEASSAALCKAALAGDLALK